MAGVLARIRSLYESLPLGQRRVADYVLGHSDEIPFLSVHALSRAARVSTATISRFARSAGHASFKDFKRQLGTEARESFNGVYHAITARDDDEQIIAKVFSGNVQSLEETLKIVDRPALIRAAKAIAKSSRTVFWGIGSSGNIAHDAAMRFSQLGMPAEGCGDSYRMLTHAFRLKKGQVAVGISHSGRSAMTLEGLKLARQNGATIVGISNYLKSPLQAISDFFLCTSFPESRVKVAALSSRIAQMCMIDALYLLVARHTRGMLAAAEKLNIHTEEILRLPGK